MIFMIRESCLKFCIRASILNFLSCGARSALYPLAEVRGYKASTVKVIGCDEAFFCGSLFSEGLVPLSKDHSRQQNLCVQSESTPPKRKACTKRRRYILQPTPEFGSSDYFNSSLGGSSPNHFTYILVNSPLARALSMAVSMAFMSSGLFLLTGKPKDSLLRTSGRW